MTKNYRRVQTLSNQTFSNQPLMIVFEFVSIFLLPHTFSGPIMVPISTNVSTCCGGVLVQHGWPLVPVPSVPVKDVGLAALSIHMKSSTSYRLLISKKG